MVPTKQRAAAYKPRQTERTWIIGAVIDAAIISGATLATTLFLLFISGQIHDTTSGDLMASSSAPQTTTFAQPTPPAQLSHPGPSPQPARPLPTPMPSAPAGGAIAETASDTEIQAEIDKSIANDPNLSTLDITATVTEGKVILVGTVPANDLKLRIEKLVRAVKGVKAVDNQIAVVSGTLT